jgi:hypothetical protein
MSMPNVNNTLKRLRNHYRLVITNEDTFEEIVKFKLTRLSVYIVLSTIFILMVGLTTALIVFTPLKYYLPGSGMQNVRQIKEYRNLKMRTDSMEQALKYQDAYLKNIEKVLMGNTIQKDTAKLALPKDTVVKK